MSDWSDAERRAPVPSEEAIYGNIAATDGTPLTSKRRHRDYMKANGLALASDYTDTWAKAAKKREDFFSGRTDIPGRKEAIAHAYDSLKGRKR